MAAAAKSPTCSVVISTRDRPESLARCLQSVRDQGERVVAVIVVDSAPRLADARPVAARFGVNYLRVDLPGLSRARNRGARAASGELVLFLDDDVVLEAGCIAALVAEFEDPRVMAVSGRIVLQGGDDAARAAFESFGGFDPGPHRRVVDLETAHWFELVNFGGLGCGAMLALRRSVFEAWQGFDERIGRGAPLDGGEELLAYFSLVAGGYRVVYSPAAVARHPAPASLAELRRRVLKDAATGSAYLTLLIVEYAGFRRAAVTYATEALRGKRRTWRSRATGPRDSVTPRWRVRLAWATGPLLYARMRLMAMMTPPASRADG
jgi:cellulose synthase/poly-beta-1,6-N-acetylglucosamine synthase-like glycosyltransferase